MQTARLVFVDRRGDRLDVERAQRAQVDDLGADAVIALQSLGNVQRAHRGEGVSDERDVARPRARPRASPIGVTKLGVQRHLAALLVDRQVLDDQHRIIIADRRLEQPLGVGRRWPAPRP